MELNAFLLLPCEVYWNNIYPPACEEARKQEDIENIGKASCYMRYKTSGRAISAHSSNNENNPPFKD